MEHWRVLVTFKIKKIIKEYPGQDFRNKKKIFLAHPVQYISFDIASISSQLFPQFNAVNVGFGRSISVSE